MAPKAPPKISTEDFLIAFGPNDTFIARAPGNISRSLFGATADVTSKVEGSKRINFAVFPTEQTANSHDPYLSYSKKGHIGDSKLALPDVDYIPDLTTWLKARWGTGGVQVVGNGQGGWWGLTSSGSASCSTGLPRDIRQLLKPYNPHGKAVHLAFGINDAYVIVFEDGHIDWDLKNCYDGLDAELEARGQGELVYVSLSPYAVDCFFAAFSNAAIRFEFPDVPAKDWMDLEEDFLAVESLRVIVPSETAKHSALPVSKKPSAMRDFSTTVLKDVAEKSLVTAVTS